MCTAATYQTKDFYFGRTLDYEFSYGDEIAAYNCEGTEQLRQNMKRWLNFRKNSPRQYCLKGLDVSGKVPLYRCF